MKRIDWLLLGVMWAGFGWLAETAHASAGFVLTEPVLIALIASATATFASIATLVVTIINNRKVSVVGEKIEEVHKATNSMKDALVAAALKEGHGLGVADEKVKRAEKDVLHATAVAEGRAEVEVEKNDEAAAKAEGRTEGLNERKTQ